MTQTKRPPENPGRFRFKKAEVDTGFGSERLTGALLDRLTHHVSILEMNGDSYRLGESRSRKPKVEA